jgi:hypothetical protein
MIFRTPGRVDVEPPSIADSLMKDTRSQRFEDTKKSMIDQVKEIKIWDSTQIYNSSRISGATNKGVDNRARQLKYPWGPLS